MHEQMHLFSYRNFIKVREREISPYKMKWITILLLLILCMQEIGKMDLVEIREIETLQSNPILFATSIIWI